MAWSLPSAAGQRPAAAYTLRTHSTGGQIPARHGAADRVGCQEPGHAS